MMVIAKMQTERRSSLMKQRYDEPDFEILPVDPVFCLGSGGDPNLEDNETPFLEW